MTAVLSVFQAGFLLMLLIAGLTVYAYNVASLSDTPNTREVFGLIFIIDILGIGITTLFYILNYGRDVLKTFTMKQL